MSYLNNLRLVFSGRFQSDVSTVNNDVRHFDNEVFKSEYQQYGKRATNGWWNPCGSGAFRLIDCKVTEVGYSDGTTTDNHDKDPVVGMTIGGSDSRVSGKMVDLDPQMQMVSEIWGLTMRLTDGKTPGFFEGKFLPAPFRDILFGRQQGAESGDQTATAVYQSVLTDLSWAEDNDGSLFLRELRELADKVGKLSVRMMVYSYNMDHKSPEFTIGRVSGVIGPALANEPASFILGRRFAPLNGSSTVENINFFNAQVDEANNHLCVDFSNALPLSGGEGDFVDIGDLQLVVLGDNFKEGALGLSDAQGDFVPIGSPIPYRDPSWMKNTGALYNIALTDEMMAKVQGSPLGLLRTEHQGNALLIRETAEGLLVRVDQVVHRLMPTADVKVDFYAARYGIPSVGEGITVALQPPMPGQGKGPEDVDAKTPVINIPASAISFDPPIISDNLGKAGYSFYATAPGNPRGYIDGQIYLLGYQPTESSGYIQYQFDIIALHVFDAFTQPKVPTWEDIQPIMVQYGNLYPVMSRMLVDLGNYESVVKFRDLLELAFAKPIEDPNHMPVTRDLSPAKREMILDWLTARDDQGNYLLRRGDVEPDKVEEEPQPCASCSFETEPAKALEAAVEERMLGSKHLADAQYRRHLKK